MYRILSNRQCGLEVKYNKDFILLIDVIIHYIEEWQQVFNICHVW